MVSITHSRVLGYLFLLSIILNGCATSPRFESEVSSDFLLKSVRALGVRVKSAQGTAWLKVASDEFNGQYSTTVQVPDQNHLKLSFDNILGGTEATIVVNHKHYQITRGEGKAGKVQGQGDGTWGGIPLEWATSLFLGRVPCPQPQDVTGVEQPQKGQLVVRAKDSHGGVERFTYTFISKDGRPWPDTLHWEKESSKDLLVDFKFDQPEVSSGSPKKWEARSSRGLVKVIWKDRAVLEAAPN